MRGIEDTSVLGVGLQSGVGQLGIGYLGVRGEGLNTDGLSLDLQFATDKTLTARKGPTPVFTRASTATFVGSDGLIQSAAINAARFDHDPLTLACKGLLIEESRTNSWSASEALGASPWSTTNTTTATLNDTTSPDGLTTAEKFTVGSTTQEYGFTRNTFSFVSGTAYSIGFFFKANQITRINIITNNQVLLPINAIFDLTGSGSIVGTPTGTASIQQFSNGWYRCSVSTTALLGGITSVRVAAVSGTSISYPGNSVDSFWAWGAQLEAGSFPTSYIPTVASSVVRSADVCSITGANFNGMWNQSEGTFLAQTQKTSTNSNAFVISASDNSFNNETDLRYNSVSQTAALINVSGASQTTGFQANITSGSAVKQSIAYKLNDCAFVANGASPISDTSALIPTVDRLTIGNVAVVGSIFYLNGTIAQIRYFKKRLPNAKLQALTA
jgi:hypothetical protein